MWALRLHGRSEREQTMCTGANRLLLDDIHAFSPFSPFSRPDDHAPNGKYDPLARAGDTHPSGWFPANEGRELLCRPL